MELIINRLSNPLLTRTHKLPYYPTDDKVFLDFINRRHIPNNILYLAMINGLVGLIKYLKREPFNMLYDEDYRIFPVARELYKGNFQILNSLSKKRQSKIKNNQLYFDVIMGYGSFEDVKYLIDSGAAEPLSVRQQGIDIAAKNGNLKMIILLEQNGLLTVTQDTIDKAAFGGNVDLIKWLNNRENNKLSIREIVMDYVIGDGKLEMVKWFIEHYKNIGHEPVKFNQKNIEMAIKNGHFEMVKWIFEQDEQLNFPINKWYVNITVGNGHLDMLKWFIRKSKKYIHIFSLSDINQSNINNAAGNGHIEMVKYLHEKQIIYVDQKGVDKAAQSGYLEMVKYLLKDKELKLNIPDNMKLIFDNFYF